MNETPKVVAAFGPFRLSPATREFLRNGIPVTLGDRALDLLIALVARAGEVISHRELIASVWRDLVVSPGNLRVHMSTLRKALGDGEGGAHYIANVTGQGYCFVAPVTRVTDRVVSKFRALPATLERMVGRDSLVREIVHDLRTDRFVSIVGPGGMGKTTVAIAAANTMRGEFEGAVCFVDLGAITDSKLVAPSIANALGLVIQAADVLPPLLDFLQTVRLLLVLDNCEHVINVAAPLAEIFFSQSPLVHILATSRESLRVEGERPHWLPPLESPPAGGREDAATVLEFSAVKLFVERAVAGDRRFVLSDANAPLVADICRRLDGMALAIEVVAGRVGSYGLQGAADLLERRLGLHWQGRRTALPRHQTLHSLLTWSYELLSNDERDVLRRLSIFVGAFSIEDAIAVAAFEGDDQAQLATVVDQLTAKSLLAVREDSHGAPAYRLLETLRTFALDRLQETGEESATAERHALYFTRRLESRAAPHTALLPNVRTALSWSFAEEKGAYVDTRTRIGIRLAAAAVSMFFDLSLHGECHRWSKQAIQLLEDQHRGHRSELLLLEGWAISSIWTRGGDDVRAILARGLTLARAIGDRACAMRLLAGLQMLLVRGGEFHASLEIADEMSAAACGQDDAVYAILADWMRGIAQHFTGRQAAACESFERGFARAGPHNIRVSGLDYRVRSLITFARASWLNGFPDRAMKLAHESNREARKAGNSLDICYSLLFTAPVFLWCGDLEVVRKALVELRAHPHCSSLPTLWESARTLEASLLLRDGKGAQGIEHLEEAVNSLRAGRQYIILNWSLQVLAQALSAHGQFSRALLVIDEVIGNSVDGGELLELPEMLRIKSEILLAMPDARVEEARECLARSLDCARRHGALAFELRATMALARLQLSAGEKTLATKDLATMLGKFNQGFDSEDLRAARKVVQAAESPDKNL